jgi:hypothetical protein
MRAEGTAKSSDMRKTSNQMQEAISKAMKKYQKKCNVDGRVI